MLYRNASLPMDELTAAGLVQGNTVGVWDADYRLIFTSGLSELENKEEFYGIKPWEFCSPEQADDVRLIWFELSQSGVPVHYYPHCFGLLWSLTVHPLPAGQDFGDAVFLSSARLVAGGDKLTPRETDILGLLGDGIEPKAIAGELFISHGTVKTHIQRMQKKLNLQGYVALVAFAARSKIH